ncbi:MAG TPA: hypothetical protein VFF52_23455 [Isosphaeraceae bacterium]|nr:hypothetical protein [Isosphaeraceae bacterium]
MTDDHDQTNSPPPEFDFSSYPGDSLFHDRRTGAERRRRPRPAAAEPASPAAADGLERRRKKERRRRIDPTTFEKQYTDDEMEFMNAMQRFKELSGKAFPTHGDVLKVAIALGYRRAVIELDPGAGEVDSDESVILLTPFQP